MPPIWLLVPLALLSLAVLSAVHALGHALVALVRTEGEVHLRLHARRCLGPLRCGRLRIETGPDEVDFLGGSCRYDFERCPRLDLLLVALAGPGASLVVTLLMFLLWQRTGGLLHEAVFLVAVNAAGLTAFNMLPLSLLEDRQPDAKRVTLDGYQAIYALVGPPPAESGSCDVSPPGFPPVRAGSRGASSGARG